jgi:HEAT repeat protein
VNQSTSLSEANNDIIFALLSTLNSDINVNVRLASCEALYKWKDEPLVRKGLITSLGNQSDPAVQITIIHMLVEMKEKQAIPEIRKLVQSNQVLKIVKTNAEQGIARLL